MRASGNCVGSLQAWMEVPFSRQPVSPITTMRRGCATGSFSATPSIVAVPVDPAGIAASHSSTGNVVFGAERWFSVSAAPPTEAAGQLVPGVMARASTVLLGPYWIQRLTVWAWAAPAVKPATARMAAMRVTAAPFG